MIDQLIVGNKASYDDFEASVKERHIGAAPKKSVKETVPFSNVTYDFSAINGEIYWGERSLEYVFEITGDTPEEMEAKKGVFLSWIMNIKEEELHDPFIRGYHFIATYEDVDPDDSEVEKTTLTVTFTAYPYMISNEIKTVSKPLAANVDAHVNITNNSSHRIVPTFVSDVPFTVTMGGASYSVPAGETTDDDFMFAAGENQLTVRATKNGTLTIRFYEEVF